MQAQRDEYAAQCETLSEQNSARGTQLVSYTTSPSLHEGRAFPLRLLSPAGEEISALRNELEAKGEPPLLASVHWDCNPIAVAWRVPCLCREKAEEAGIGTEEQQQPGG